MTSELQAERLAAVGASDAETEELWRYNENHFNPPAEDVTIPLDDEPFVVCWAEWVDEARERGAFNVLASHLPQLRFPVREGISNTEAYRDATLRGVPVEDLPEATGLEIGRPELLTLEIYPSSAGRVPVFAVRGRQEFEVLVQALAKKNEPAPIPPSQGAAMVAGFNNWERIRKLQRQWEALKPDQRSTQNWSEEFARIRQHRELYQDRFMILSDGPYSAVPASELALSDREWRELSLKIRREHECTHYFTRRRFGSMRNHLLDELIADYAGLVAATGSFRADWFLRFMGLEDFPRYRRGGRLDLYRGDPPLSAPAFELLRSMVKDAAEGLEAFDRVTWSSSSRRPADRAAMIEALTTLRLDEIASREAHDLLSRALEKIR